MKKIKSSVLQIECRSVQYASYHVTRRVPPKNLTMDEPSGLAFHLRCHDVCGYSRLIEHELPRRRLQGGRRRCLCRRCLTRRPRFYTQGNMPCKGNGAIQWKLPRKKTVLKHVTATCLREHNFCHGASTLCTTEPIALCQSPFVEPVRHHYFFHPSLRTAATT
jgi:hypothetical protein